MSNTSELSFPQVFAISPKPDQGMTLRDYFAAKAMQTMLQGSTGYDDIAKYAYMMADEMLEAREQ